MRAGLRIRDPRKQQKRYQQQEGVPYHKSSFSELLDGKKPPTIRNFAENRADNFRKKNLARALPPGPNQFFI
jgi:hypothetical protein